MAEMYLVSHEDMVSVADEIRAKSGKSDELVFPDGWKESINTLSSEEQLKATAYPDYVSPEAFDVIEKVRSVQQSDSITFIAMSDSHYPAEQTATSDYANNTASSLQANMAMKSMAYLLNADFVAHLGDVCTGASTTTPDMLKSQIEGFLSYFKEAKSDIPVFLAVGNHDGGIYYHEAKADGTNYCMTGEYLYDIFTSQSASDNTVFGDTTYGGYCYRDFTDKKLRVFLLNTSEGMAFRQTDSCTLAAQRLWFANALLDLNNKSDASLWSFVVLCHYPADYGGTMPLSTLIKAYVTGGSTTITGNSDEGFTNTSVSFSGQNSAKFIAQFHGHVHNFKTSKLHDASAVQYDAWRMCIPNVQYNRENYYGEFNGVNFAEDISYNKTANTADGTSFVVNVINPSEEKIYSFCYGAGYDRVIGYGAVTYYSISRNLANVTTDNTVVSIEEGRSYSEIITLDSGYDMNTISVTMGGVDISSSAITIVEGAYHISITEVTGNVVITAKAMKPPTTNLGLIAEAQDSTAIYNNGLGYKNGYRLASGNPHEETAAGYVITGWIPYHTDGQSIPETIEISGVTLDDSDASCRIYFYQADKSTSQRPWVDNISTHWSDVYTIETLGDKHYRLTPIATNWGTWIGNNGLSVSCEYIRLSLKGAGEDFIIKIGDSEVVSYNVTYNLTHVESSNNATSVEKGSSYSTTFVLNNNYELESVTITMGGVDITNDAYQGNGVIKISSVTGVIEINAVATETVQTNYTNQLPISTDTDGTIYNGKGYKENSYLSSSGGGISSKTGYYTTGFIPAKLNDVIRFANITSTASDGYCRMSFYDSSKAYIANLKCNTGGFGSPVFDSNGNLSQISISRSSYLKDTIAYIRFCCAGMGNTSIITVNEPIE